MVEFEEPPNPGDNFARHAAIAFVRLPDPQRIK
jgi:hypothetical protein